MPKLSLVQLYRNWGEKPILKPAESLSRCALPLPYIYLFLHIYQCPLDCTLKYVDRNSNEVLLRVINWTNRISKISHPVSNRFASLWLISPHLSFLRPFKHLTDHTIPSRTILVLFSFFFSF